VSPRIRPARPEDLTAVAAFTEGTFEWGDYVADSFLGWIDQAGSHLLVAVDDDDTAIGVARMVELSPDEVWLHAARVHTDHRRSGVGTLLNEECCRVAREKGARVARLLIEVWNDPARRQVAKLGYHETGRWVFARKNLAMEPTTNGSRRVGGDERLTPARRTEVDLAWMTWSNGDLAYHGRMLFPEGWLFRLMTPDDLEQAVRSGRLWQCPSGSIIGGVDEDGVFDVSWVQTTDVDATRLVKAIIDVADSLGAEEVQAMAPSAPWLCESLEHYGFSLRPSSVWALPL
jgi:ribosomal protein S18 acetylase RimI-like enzyme